MQVAQQILKQLGGKKFLAMTGAKNLMSTENGLRMNLPKNQSGATVLSIELNSLDLYEMTFLKVRNYQPIEVKKTTGLYFDMLQPEFTKTTGFNTNL